MNKLRRKQIQKAVEKINDGLSELRGVMDEEQDAFDNLSEGLQQTMRGEAMESNVDMLDEVIEQIEEALESLDGIE